MSAANPNRRWIAVVALPWILVALATWAVVTIPAIGNWALPEVMLRSSSYDMGCWLRRSPSVALIGGSMAFNGVVPNVVAESNQLAEGDVVVLGQAGRTPLSSYVTYRRNEARLKDARIVYHPLDPWILNLKYLKNARRERLFWTPQQWRFIANSLDIDDGYFAPWGLLAREVLAVAFTEQKCRYEPHRANGYRAKRRRHKEIKPKAPGTYPVTLYDDMDLFGASARQIGYLAEIKRRVESNGGTFVFFLTPKHPTFIDIYRTKSEYDAAIVAALNAQLGPMRVVGSMHGERYQLIDKHFADFTHLSRTGARRFSKLAFADLEAHIKQQPKPLGPLLDY